MLARGGVTALDPSCKGCWYLPLAHWGPGECWDIICCGTNTCRALQQSSQAEPPGVEVCNRVGLLQREGIARVFFPFGGRCLSQNPLSSSGSQDSSALALDGRF